MKTLFQDIRYGLRMLGKSPGFTAVAAITLALGIGANTAIFSIVNAVLLRPLPYYQPDRLMAVAAISVHARPGATNENTVSYPDFFDWRSRNRSFEAIASYYNAQFTLTRTGQPLHLSGDVVSADFFRVLGVTPFRGRGFNPEEERPGSRVVVISHDLWQSVFGADEGILRRSITLNHQIYQVVGVMPPGFAFPIRGEAPKLWVSLARDNEPAGGDPAQSSVRGAHFLSVIGRLKPSVSLAQANDDMNLIAQALAKEYPDTNVNFSTASVTSELDALVGRSRRGLMLLLGAVGCVLLIACVNVANLLLARAGHRSREMAVRGALGASRSRIIQQLFTESLLLAMAGAVLAMPVAAWSIRLFLALDVQNISRIQTTSLDGRVLAFTCAVAALTSLIFGLAPALRASNPNLVQSLREAGRGGGDGVSHQRLRGALVIAETAIGLVLLVAAGLLLRTFQHLLHVDPGFDSRETLTVNFELPEARYNPDQQVSFYDQLLPRLRRLPGVASVSAVDSVPLSGQGYAVGFAIEGRPLPPRQRPIADLNITAPGYFRALGIPIASGRDFTEQDNGRAPGVLIVSQSFAKKYFPGEDPVGKYVKPGFSVNGEPAMRQIVGVAGDVKRSLDSEARPRFYIPYAQGVAPLAICVRSAGVPAMSLLPAVREEIRRMDADLALYDVRQLSEYVSASMGQHRFQAYLFGAFALLALVLTGVGLYGVMAYLVAQRTHEIGVRMSLGASATNVVGMVLRSAMALAGAGIAAGLLGAIALTRFLEGMLFGIQPLDPITYVAVTGVLLAVSLLAGFIPARRATRVDPMVALRCE